MDRALSDDCLRKVLTFVSVADCARGAGAASKAMRGVASTTNRARFTEKYVLRGDTHGVVHALATGFGTRRWPTRRVALYHSAPLANWPLAAVPPARLGITIHREGELHFDPDEEPYASFVDSAIVDPDITRAICGGGECGLATGSTIQYELPFQLQITAFSFGFADCGAQDFKDWTFEAFDGEEWHQLYYSALSPWPYRVAASTHGNYRPRVFQLSNDGRTCRCGVAAERYIHIPGGGRACYRCGSGRLCGFFEWESDVVASVASFASNRFRIRLLEGDHHAGEGRCMHIRGLELFGTILPPWRID